MDQDNRIGSSGHRDIGSSVSIGKAKTLPLMNADKNRVIARDRVIW
jgi:hypothetical protein